MVWWRGLVVIAFGSYPKGRKFKSYRHHQYRSWPHGQAVKTPPFHGGIMGSNPVGVTSIEKRLSERKVFFHNDICSDEQVKGFLFFCSRLQIFLRFGKFCEKCFEIVL